jgi:thiol-disulfide isomerase/thioredoxin
MVLCRIVWKQPRKRPTKYADVCLLFNGGCQRYGPKWIAEWCPSCRRLRAERAAKEPK